jgi:hypothetical protein
MKKFKRLLLLTVLTFFGGLLPHHYAWAQG